MDINQKIEQERVLAGFTQDEMADRLGIKRSTYQYWEKKTPSLAKIERVEKALNLPKGFFTDEKFRNDEKPVKTEIAQGDVFKEKYLALLEEVAEERKQKNSLIEELIKKQTPSKSKDQEGVGSIVEVSGEINSASMDSRLTNIEEMLRTMLDVVPYVLSGVTFPTFEEADKKLRTLAVAVQKMTRKKSTVQVDK
jgi:transcriptional regulator with XRE-family HTH domain